MNFLLVHIVKIKFTRNTIPNAITPNTIKPRNLFSFAQKKKKHVQPLDLLYFSIDLVSKTRSKEGSKIGQVGKCKTKQEAHIT